MTAHVIRGDARNLPLPDESVDLIVTSPPYFALRSYSDGGEHYAGQIGSETTPAEYVAALADCTREWVRVLKPSGSIWVNLGDKYAGYANLNANRIDYDWGGVRGKSLMGLPWRYALACIDQLGLILRAEIVWSKPNALPESVTDRARRSHEQWFHFTRQPRYYSAVDEIREPASDYSRPNGSGREPRGGQKPRKMLDTCNPLGKLPGSVWEIHSEPLKVPDHLGVSHFAAFPTEWPRRIIAGWSPPGICVECGEGRRPVAHAEPAETRGWALRQRGCRNWHGDGADPTRSLGVTAADRKRTITGYVCACPEPTAPTRPAIVLDPFGGTGTTALVASALGRIGLTVDRSADYCRLATWRTTDPGQRAKVLGVAPPQKQLEGQLGLFDGEGAA